jgi:hypothetical protein
LRASRRGHVAGARRAAPPPFVTAAVKRNTKWEVVKQERRRGREREREKEKEMRNKARGRKRQK